MKKKEKREYFEHIVTFIDADGTEMGLVKYVTMWRSGGNIEEHVKRYGEHLLKQHAAVRVRKITEKQYKKEGGAEITYAYRRESEEDNRGSSGKNGSKGD